EGGEVFGVAAKDGKLLWKTPMFKGSSYAIAPTPIVLKDLVYVTAGYGAGCHLIKLTAADGKFTAEDQYNRRAQKSVKNTHGGAVVVGGHMYGHSEGVGWVCQELKKGTVVWNERNKLECKSGGVTAVEDMLYFFSDEGELALLKATPTGWDEHGT